MNATEQQLEQLFKTSISTESFAIIQEELSKQNELELTTTAIFCMSKVLKENTEMPVVKLMKLGEIVQTLEHLCAKIKKVILDTPVSSFLCPGESIPPMTLEFHLKGCNYVCGKHEEISFE